jgi:hypothetical protein
MSQTLIRTAYESRLATWAAAHSPVLQVAWQNAAFTPPAATHLRCFLLPAATGSDDLKGDHRQYLGVFQVSIVVPDGAGPAAPETILGELNTLFPMNLRLTSGAITVSQTSPVSAGPGQNEPGLYVVPVSFRYRSDVI